MLIFLTTDAQYKVTYFMDASYGATCLRVLCAEVVGVTASQGFLVLRTRCLSWYQNNSVKPQKAIHTIFIAQSMFITNT